MNNLSAIREGTLQRAEDMLHIAQAAPKGNNLEFVQSQVSSQVRDMRNSLLENQAQPASRSSQDSQSDSETMSQEQSWPAAPSTGPLGERMLSEDSGSDWSLPSWLPCHACHASKGFPGPSPVGHATPLACLVGRIAAWT